MTWWRRETHEETLEGYAAASARLAEGLFMRVGRGDRVSTVPGAILKDVLAGIISEARNIPRPTLPETVTDGDFEITYDWDQRGWEGEDFTHVLGVATVAADGTVMDSFLQGRALHSAARLDRVELEVPDEYAVLSELALVQAMHVDLERVRSR